MIRSPVSADVGVNLYIMEYAGTITRKPFRPVLISQAKIPKKCYTIGALNAIIARLKKVQNNQPFQFCQYSVLGNSGQREVQRERKHCKGNRFGSQ